MTKELQKELKQSIGEMDFYTFINEHCYELSKSELKDLAKELYCMVFTDYMEKDDLDIAAEVLINNLEENTTIFES